MTTFMVYTVMVKEERGWRQLVARVLRPHQACEALADLIRDRKPLDQLTDQDQQYMTDARSLCDQDDCELTIDGRRHHLVCATLLIRTGPDGPEGPGPHDRTFTEFPWPPDT
jgi:uncharacterized protein DUF5954